MFVDRGKPPAQELLESLRQKKLHIATAESCTGGMISTTLTSIAGSSDVVNGGIVSYTNKVKHDVLGVKTETLENFTAVSEECTREMAEGAAKLLCAETAISISGIAGPTGGTENQPVGTVCFGFYVQGVISSTTKHFSGDRQEVRCKATIFAIQNLLEKIKFL
ncbi:MAG: CinA family protein [Treponema sp.]|jgi:nicotinamide-nucleotide amidase|nr:CinA family protein [Treponema sp.]